MRTFTFNPGFILIFISFCCSVAVGSPPSGTGTSTTVKDFRQNLTNIQTGVGALTTDEIFSPKKFLKKYLETAKKQGHQEKMQGHPQIVGENEAHSLSGENGANATASAREYPPTPIAGEQFPAGEEKGTQTSAVDNVSFLPATDEKPPASPVVVTEKAIQDELPVVEGSHPAATGEEIAIDNQETDVHSMPIESGSETASVAERQPPADKRDVTQVYGENNKPHPPLTGKDSPVTEILEENASQKRSLTVEGSRPIASFPETGQEVKEEGAPMTIATPEFRRETIVRGELQPSEAEGNQTVDPEGESRPIIGGNGTPFTAEGETPYAHGKENSNELAADEKEQKTETSSPETTAESAVSKEREKSKPLWDILHRDPTHNVILAVVITLIAAKVAEWMARMLRLPAVVGTLIMGMILGNVFTFTGWDFFHFLRAMPFLKMVSYFGTLILLFTAGLHTDIRALLRVGVSSFLVCLGGIVVPAWLGLMVGHFLLPDATTGAKLLIAILLCNTGMGLLMAVLGELKLINTQEGRILTGAAVITEIIVILTFGLVSGFVVRGGTSIPHILVTIGIAISFLAIILIIILRYGEKFGNFLTKRVTEGLNIPIVVISALLLAFMSGSIGLHTVIGAFVAGLLLRNLKLKDYAEVEYGAVERIIRPYSSILVPILFVRVGAQVEMESFLNLNAAILGLAITGAAIIGKMFCSVCPVEKGVNRLIIGIGMAMKLEGTLILAGIGRDIGILDDIVFSSIIMVIVCTSVLCPLFLKASLARQKKRHSKKFRVTVDENTKEVYLHFKSDVRR